MTSRRWIVVTSAVGLLLTGCTGDRPESPALSPSPSPVTATANRETPFAVEGRDYREIAQLPATVDGRTSFLVGITSKGTQVLVTTSDSPDPSVVQSFTRST